MKIALPGVGLSRRLGFPWLILGFLGSLPGCTPRSENCFDMGLTVTETNNILSHFESLENVTHANFPCGLQEEWLTMGW